MTQYLLSVHSVDGEAGEPMTDEQMRQTAASSARNPAGRWLP
jgi:hypothetical protein